MTKTKEMRRRSVGRTYLVAKTLRCDDGDFIADAFVRLEVEGEFGVVPLDDDFGGLLDGLATDSLAFGFLIDLGPGKDIEELTFVRTRPILTVLREYERDEKSCVLNCN